MFALFITDEAVLCFDFNLIEAATEYLEREKMMEIN